MHLNSNMREALAWRLIAELMRRHGAHYELARLQPGGGQYDCLSLIESGSPRLMLNLGASVTVWRSGTVEHLIDADEVWLPMLSSEGEGEGRGLGSILDRISGLLERPVPSPLPQTTRRVLSVRVMASASLLVSMERSRWRWANGFIDTSGYGGGVKLDWFERFPLALEALGQIETGPREVEGAYRYWFWLRDDEPQICVGMDGRCLMLDGSSIDVMSLYAERRRLSDAVFGGLGGVLP